MELWLLVGAVVLVALTVWIVWPTQRSEEVPTMTESSQRNLPPQGDTFEDQYTSATADLSAGGVATTRDAGATPLSTGAQLPETAAGSEPWSSPTMAREGTDQTPMQPEQGSQGMAVAGRRKLGISGATVLVVGGGVAGAWLYQRWQRERARPINRFRRGARDLAGRLQDVDLLGELPENRAPMGGAAAAALIISSLLVARARRRIAPAPPRELPRREQIFAKFEHGRARARQLKMPEMNMPARLPEMGKPPRQQVLGGVGIGGLMVLVGGAVLIWRLLKGGSKPGPEHYYAGDRMGE
jgi:hypothetical protein